MAERKIFAGARLRRLRNRLRLAQGEMAAALGISPSYLNLIERNQRPLTVQVLLRLSSTYGIDVGELRSEADDRALSALKAVFSDPLIAAELPSPSELEEVAEAAPNVAVAVTRLHDAYRESVQRLSELSHDLARADGARPEPPAARLPFDRVTAFLEAEGPFFPAVEEEAAALAERLEPREDAFGALRAHLRERRGIDVKILPTHVIGEAMARYDRHSQRLFLSERVPPDERALLVARQVALLDHAPLLEALVAAAGFGEAEAARLARLQFARRFAEALVVPAPRLSQAARDLRHDLLHLAARFGVSVTTVMERLAAVGASGAAGARRAALLVVDPAGSVLRRVNAHGLAFPRHAAPCARLPLYDACSGRGVAAVPLLAPDGTALLGIAAREERASPVHGDPPRLRLALLALAAEDAADTVYAAGSAPARPVGVTCRLCERVACHSRTQPPVTHPSAFADSVIGLSDHEFA